MKCLIIFVLLAVLLTVPVHAADVQSQLAQELGVEGLVDALPDDVQRLLAEYDLHTGEGWSAVIDKLRQMALQTVLFHLDAVWRPAIQSLLITAVCGMLHAMLPHERYSWPIVLSGSAAILHVTLEDTRSLFRMCVEALSRMYDFSTILLPCLAGASAFSGASVSSGVKYTAAALIMNLLLHFTGNFLVPLISVYLACVICGVVFERKILQSLSGVIHKLCISMLTGSVVVFTTYLGVAGPISGTGDALAANITKSALSAGLPVVGSILSDAAAVLVSGAAMLRNAIGLFGMLAVVAILLVPFLGMGIRYLLFKAVAMLAELFPNHRFSGLLRGISGAYGMLLASVGTGFVLMFLSVISFMRAVGG